MGPQVEQKNITEKTANSDEDSHHVTAPKIEKEKIAESKKKGRDDVASLPPEIHHDNVVSADNHANRAVANENENNNNNKDGEMPSTHKTNGGMQIVKPHSMLPKPEVPPGLYRSKTAPSVPSPAKNYDAASSFSLSGMPSIGKFIRQQSNDLSLAISKRLSSRKENPNDELSSDPSQGVTEFNLSGLRVIVMLKNGDELQIKGRISVFSRSNCRDCTAVRRFFREKGLKFVEINIDVYPERERELLERTGSSLVPQIFFNEKLFGGLAALNYTRKNGDFEQWWGEVLSMKCPDDAPAPPVYGFDQVEDDQTDEMIGIVRLLRQKLPIQDRMVKMVKIVRNCFAATELAEVLMHHLGCDRIKAIEIGKKSSRKHFIHHVFGENDFEDGKHFYRFLEHEPIISRCFNFSNAINDSEPKPASAVCQRLTKIMSAILESYASDDRRCVDYDSITKSEEFRRYVNMTQDLQRVNLDELTENERLAFFLNLYNAMVIHAIIRLGCPEGIIDRKAFFSDFQYLVGGHPYSLNVIKNGILRGNRRPPYTLTKPLGAGDRRLELALVKMNPLIHFGICNGTKSSPQVRFFSPQGAVDELRRAAREFFENDGIEVDLEKRTVNLTRIIRWFMVDFGQEKDILRWIINYLDASKAGLLTHLLNDGGPITISYQNFDWSLNSSKV